MSCFLSLIPSADFQCTQSDRFSALVCVRDPWSREIPFQISGVTWCYHGLVRSWSIKCQASSAQKRNIYTAARTQYTSTNTKRLSPGAKTVGPRAGDVSGRSTIRVLATILQWQTDYELLAKQVLDPRQRCQFPHLCVPATVHDS